MDEPPSVRPDSHGGTARVAGERYGDTLWHFISLLLLSLLLGNCFIGSPSELLNILGSSFNPLPRNSTCSKPWITPTAESFFTGLLGD